MATETPPAPKSLHFFIREAAFLFLKRRCSFLSSGALPFWTSAPHSSMEETLCDFDEPVAPPMPSRPVLPPISTTISPGTGGRRFTFSAGAAPTTAPSSICLAT